jgi:phytoene desaturase
MHKEWPMRTVIIGAGAGGLATAIRLQAAGHQVTVLERNTTVGGRANRWQCEGFRFDTGPTLLLMPDVYHELFHSAGRELSEYVDLVQVRPNYRITFGDGVAFDASTDLSALAQALDRIEPGADRRLRPFLRDAGYKYRIARERFISRNFLTGAQFATPRNLVELFRTGALRNLFRYAGRFFHDERLRLAFTFQTMYLGISPLSAPAIYALLPYTELAEGIWYPRGGVYELMLAMRRLAEELGAEVRTGAQVESLDITENRVRGVRLADGSTVAADVVVANADLPYAYRALVPERLRPDFSDRRLSGMRYTASAYMLYLGVDRRYEQLLHHNVFFARDYRANFDAIFKTHTLPDQPSLYVNAPAATDPSVAPPGCEALYVLVPVPHLKRRVIDWRREEPAFRRVVIDRLEALGLTDLRRRIVVERAVTPLDWRQMYNLAYGSAFGLAHDILQVGYLRPGNRAKRLTNLYFVGASTVPGTGVPLVILGSRLVAERILSEHPAAAPARQPTAAAGRGAN